MHVCGVLLNMLIIVLCVLLSTTILQYCIIVEDIKHFMLLGGNVLTPRSVGVVGSVMEVQRSSITMMY